MHDTPVSHDEPFASYADIFIADQSHFQSTYETSGGRNIAVSAALHISG